MQTAAPSLTVRALLARAAARAGLDGTRSVTAGLTPAAKALAAAVLTRTMRGVVLLVVPTDKDVEQVTADARFFYGALEGASASQLEGAILPFPSWQIDPYRGIAPHFRVSAARARALHAAAVDTARLIVASAPALLPLVSPPARLLRASIEIRPGVEIEPQALADLLTDAGLSREDPVDEHGVFTVRGGIVDVFPAADVEPARIEFVGDMVESIRRFDPATQRSTRVVDQVVIAPVCERFEDDRTPVSLFEYLRTAGGVSLITSEYEEVEEGAQKARRQFDVSYADALERGQTPAYAPDEGFARWGDVEPALRPAGRLAELALEDETSGSQLARRHVGCQPALEFKGRVGDWVADVRAARERGDVVLFVADSHGRAERAVEILQEYDVAASLVEGAEDVHAATVLVTVGRLSKGFRLAAAALQIYAETDVFEEDRRGPDRRRGLTKAFLSDLRDLKVKDLIVHVDHGIGEFVGLRQLGVVGTADAVQEFLELKYARDDKLFVPAERLNLIQKYTGGARPELDRLGGTTWEKAKGRVKKAMRDMAEELLRLYAQRKAVQGHSCSSDTHWQEEFEDAFPYELTPDQASAIADVKHDMETPTPMDRLLCGDVGYGKTEVAMRAAFKAIMDGKQVALLAPTTVLAFQHLKTLRERFSGFPVTIEMLSRFRTKQETKEVLAVAGSGKIDVIVGTHRLLSKDVQFRDLGLLVVDEEQRFGVAHKERIKQLRKTVDVLTMTATPIPRTLNMSLVGIRDMSVIETPPKDRLSIQTNVVKFDASVIERAVRTELGRGGQVYVVHNRVESIYSIGSLLRRLVPEARVVVGHGQMGEDELERAMMGFVERRYDVLLATTIVENGLDIPNANTIIINRADRYGLSQLYQLRGRVGRSDRPAYAYLLIPPQESLSAVARKRLAAIREFSDLGSGFRVAALDLEIRGAGNLLGGQQSGHIEAIGFEMYMKLLEETVRELKGEEVEDGLRSAVNLHVDLKIGEGYIPDMNQRLMVYRKVAAARTEEELAIILEEVSDRYGPPPGPVLNLAEYGRVRIVAERLGVDGIDREGQTVVVRFRPQANLDPVRLVKVVQEWPGVVLVPPASLKMSLDAEMGGSRRSTPTEKSSWWTVRATTGKVTEGFSRDSILSVPPADAQLESRIFAQLHGLLAELGK